MKTIMIPPCSMLKLYIVYGKPKQKALSGIIYNNSAESRFYDYEDVGCFGNYVILKRINQNTHIFFDEYEIEGSEINET